MLLFSDLSAGGKTARNILPSSECVDPDERRSSYPSGDRILAIRVLPAHARFRKQSVQTCESRNRRPHQSGLRRRGADWAGEDTISHIRDCRIPIPGDSAWFAHDRALGTHPAKLRLKAGAQGAERQYRQRVQLGKKMDRPNSLPRGLR